MDKMWIRYEPDNGKILSITNELNYNLNGKYVEIDIFTATEFIEQTKNPDDYVVMPDLSDPNRAKLINTKEEQIDYDISKNIYQIDKQNSNTPVNFTVVQTDTSWQIRVSDYLKDIIKTNDFYRNKVYNFYITNQNDPNILLDKFQIKLEDLLNGQIEITDIDTSVCRRDDVSVYTYKEFDTYAHIIKR